MGVSHFADPGIYRRDKIWSLLIASIVSLAICIAVRAILTAIAKRKDRNARIEYEALYGTTAPQPRKDE
jgi:hypothetical protein